MYWYSFFYGENRGKNKTKIEKIKKEVEEGGIGEKIKRAEEISDNLVEVPKDKKEQMNLLESYFNIIPNKPLIIGGINFEPRDINKIGIDEINNIDPRIMDLLFNIKVNKGHPSKRKIDALKKAIERLYEEEEADEEIPPSEEAIKEKEKGDKFYWQLVDTFEKLKDYVVKPDSDILKILNIQKRNRSGARPEFILLNEDNIKEFIQTFFNIDSTNIDILEIINNNKEFDSSKLAELLAAIQMINSDGNIGVVLPLDTSYGFADYFTYDRKNPSSNNKIAISIKNTQRGGQHSALSGIESTFNYDFSQPLEGEMESDAQRKIKNFMSSEDYEKRINHYTDECIKKRKKDGSKLTTNPEEVRKQIKEAIDRGIIRAARAYILLKSGEFKDDSYREFRVQNGELIKIPIEAGNVGFKWITNSAGIPVPGYKFYTDEEMGKKSSGYGKSFSSSVQKAVHLLKSPSFSEAGFKKFMHENKLWQAI